MRRVSYENADERNFKYPMEIRSFMELYESIKLIIFIVATFSEMLLMSFDRYLEIRFDMQITDQLEKEIVQKYRKLDYRCYEEPLTYDIISRISQNPGEKIRMIYWKLCEMLKIVILLIGYLLIFQQVSSLLIVIFLVFLIPMLYENYKAGCLWYDLKNALDKRKAKKTSK